MRISIAKDFSRTPGFRFETDGPDSGELFRKTKLEPLFEDTADTTRIEIDLDGVAGYATSFLEEAFGGLARLFGIDRTLDRLGFKSDEDSLLIEEIISYIRKCNESK